MVLLSTRMWVSLLKPKLHKIMGIVMVMVGHWTRCLVMQSKRGLIMVMGVMVKLGHTLGALVMIVRVST